MKVVLHVAMAGQLAMQNQLAAIANNVANITTPGFRAEGSRFAALVSRQQPSSVSFVTAGQSYIDTRPGALKQTGNPLDVAVRGNAFMAVQGPGDTIVYTRDGRLRMLPTGELVSAIGLPVLDVSGAPIVLKPNAGPPRIARDGMITQNGRQIGAIGLFRIDDNAQLTRYGNSGVIPDREPEPIVNFRDAGIVQGFIETSNVNGAMEMAHLIQVSNAMRQLSTALTDSERTALEAIRILGGEGA